MSADRVVNLLGKSCIVVKKVCRNCSALNYEFSRQCTSCEAVVDKKDSGRPMDTKASDGYAVSTSGGRPSGTKASVLLVVPKPLTAMLWAQVVVGEKSKKRQNLKFIYTLNHAVVNHPHLM